MVVAGQCLSDDSAITGGALGARRDLPPFPPPTVV